MTNKILVVDDEDLMRKSLTDLLAGPEENQVFSAASGEEAQEILNQKSIDVLLTDLKMDGISGLELLRWTQTNSPLTETIVITAHGSVDNAVQAMKEGAFNYLTKPFEAETVEAETAAALEHHRLRARNEVLESQLELETDSIIGESPAMQRIYNQVNSLENSDISVLISGETGTGKELVARHIHESSDRKDGNFVVVDCGTLPSEIIESELFGHKKGAFTDAHETKIGKFELADGGSLFLDEIGNLPRKLQAKLLRFLQEHRFTPVGGTESREVDTRIIAATNVDLQEEIESGAFREDLYYRLNVMSINLPPLREREGDIPRLASHFLRRHAPELNPQVVSISPKALKALTGHHWPGNVRELENCIKRALTVAQQDVLTLNSLPANVQETDTEQLPKTPDIQKSLEAVEAEHIEKIIEHCEGNLSEAARKLGINRSTLYNKLDKYDIEAGGAS